jgi:hypothetical protein
MKKITTLLLIVTSLLFIGCDEKKETPKATETSSAETNISSNDVEDAKKEIKEAVNASAKVIAKQATVAKEYIKEKTNSIDVEAVKAKASESLDKAKASISQITESTKKAIEEKSSEIKKSTKASEATTEE